MGKHPIQHILKITNDIYKRSFSTSIFNRCQSNIRNIGIMAHVDAGKTTTTERMLYYTGRSAYIGEVHDGDTVMDYLPQERERGITITSAAITFHWNNKQINLVDTPGHIDFSMEVEKSLRVLDGAVAVFDGSAGAEAQSITVWHQADRYCIPKICYINKMDKDSSNLDLCVKDLQRKLEANTVVLQHPIVRKHLKGVVDIIGMKKYIWNPDSMDHGKTYELSNLTSSDGQLWEECNNKRSLIAERLSEFDNSIAEAIIEKESTVDICENLLRNSIRRCTLKREICPVFMGSSYKNIGVQLLMDGIVDYLPSPLEKRMTAKAFLSTFFVYVFKIIHHSKLGALTFCRIYSGRVKKGMKVYNLNKQENDKIELVYTPYADEFEKEDAKGEGDIVVLSGLKTSSTGDILVQSHSSAETAKKIAFEKGIDLIKELGVIIPQPVFLCSVEAPSSGQQKTMDDALARYQREDPSLRVSFDQNTQQTILSGMGELHLEVVKDRILKEYQVDVALGRLEVAYKETVLDTKPYVYNFNKLIIGSKQNVKVEMSLRHNPGHVFTGVKNFASQRNVKNLQDITRQKLALINRGVELGLDTGPVLGFPVVDVQVYLHWYEGSKFATDNVIVTVVASCIKEALKTSDSFLLEPMMRLEIVTPLKYEHQISKDILERRGQMGDVVMKKHLITLNAVCPLAELVGYSAQLRKVSSGNASLFMELANYSRMSEEQVAEVKSKMYLW